MRPAPCCSWLACRFGQTEDAAFPPRHGPTFFVERGKDIVAASVWLRGQLLAGTPLAVWSLVEFAGLKLTARQREFPRSHHPRSEEKPAAEDSPIHVTILLSNKRRDDDDDSSRGTLSSLQKVQKCV